MDLSQPNFGLIQTNELKDAGGITELQQAQQQMNILKTAAETTNQYAEANQKNSAAGYLNQQSEGKHIENLNSWQKYNDMQTLRQASMQSLDKWFQTLQQVDPNAALSYQQHASDLKQTLANTQNLQAETYKTYTLTPHQTNLMDAQANNANASAKADLMNAETNRLNTTINKQRANEESRHNIATEESQKALLPGQLAEQKQNFALGNENIKAKQIENALSTYKYNAYQTTGSLIGPPTDPKDAQNRNGIMGVVDRGDVETYANTFLNPDGSLNTDEVKNANANYGARKEIEATAGGSVLGAGLGAAVGGTIGSLVPGIGTIAGASAGAAIGGGALGTAGHMYGKELRQRYGQGMPGTKGQAADEALYRTVMALAPIQYPRMPSEQSIPLLMDKYKIKQGDSAEDAKAKIQTLKNDVYTLTSQFGSPKAQALAELNRMHQEAIQKGADQRLANQVLQEQTKEIHRKYKDDDHPSVQLQNTFNYHLSNIGQ